MRARLLALLLIAGSAAAQTPGEAAPATVPAPAHQLTAEDLGIWFDGMMPWLLARGDLAGAVVSVVKDGQVLFARGYGYADVEKRVPVDVADTLFRIGSVSKLFTWTCVMQQVEHGKLDLDRDVNSYLDFKIPDAFGKPITLRNIMTHTAGFEESGKDLFPSDASALGPLGAYLKTHIPARAYPPGEIIAYSNYGAALAGYIIERTTGMTFADYVERAIYAPLGMTRATFRQPLPAALQPFMAQGYKAGSQKPVPFEVVRAEPAGSMSASGLDMAKFMIAHLNQGGPLLKPETAARMYTATKAPAPGFNAMALGFYQEDRNGRRIIGHGGNMPVFHSDLHLLLDEKVGLFVSFNATGKEDVTGPFRVALLREFLDRYFPAPLPAGEPTLPSAAEHARAVAGFYSTSRAGVESWMRLMQMTSPVQLVVNADDTISVTTLRSPSGAVKKWREVQPFVWREVNGRSRVTVLRDEAGTPAILTHDDGAPVYVYRRASFATGPNALPLLQAALGVLLLATLSWPIAALARRHYGRALRFEGRDRLLYRLSRVACVVLLLFAAGWLLVMIRTGAGITFLSSSNDWMFWLIRLIGVIGLAGTPLLVWRAAMTWGDARFGWWGRISNSVIALAALVIIWASFAYNLLSTGLQY